MCGATGWRDATLQSVVGRDLMETPGIESVNYSGPFMPKVLGDVQYNPHGRRSILGMECKYGKEPISGLYK